MDPWTLVFIHLEIIVLLIVVAGLTSVIGKVFPSRKRLKFWMGHLNGACLWLFLLIFLSIICSFPRSVDDKDITRLSHGWLIKGTYVDDQNVYRRYPAWQTDHYSFWEIEGSHAFFVVAEYHEVAPEVVCSIIDRMNKLLIVIDGNEYKLVTVGEVQLIKTKIDNLFIGEGWVNLPQEYWSYQKDLGVKAGHLVRWVR